MGIALGIDTGGTYTDAVFVTYPEGRVIAGAKALTTRHDLSLGIDAAIGAIFETAVTGGLSIAPEDITLVSLSTTLATNTLAEGQRGRVCLLLIGYDKELMHEYGFERELATGDVVYLVGGHDGLGNEVAPLDEAAAREAILARKGRVEAFAISGYFSVRNPAHELRARELVEELAGAPVTCGHELTSQLNAVRRATTVALNAHLIAPLAELLAAVQATLARRKINAPLMVVKGDGSLVRADFARRRPIETVLSGPAASVVGAWHLAGRRDVWTVDVGGTTTDIAALKGGWPVLNVNGARVGGWRTMIQAVDVHTTGLGGDSHVRLGPERELLIGPQRAIPLCLLASDHPHILPVLRELAAENRAPWDDDLAEFLMPGRPAKTSLDPAEEEIVQRIGGEPVQAAALVDRSRSGSLARRRAASLEARGLVRRAAFTPTDALHVLGDFVRWDAEASRLAATMLAKRLRLSVTEFCEMVVRRFSQQVATEVVNKVLEDEVGRPDWAREAAGRALLVRALNGRPWTAPLRGSAQDALLVGSAARDAEAKHPEWNEVEPKDAPFDFGRVSGPVSQAWLTQPSAQSASSSDLGCTLTLRRPLVAIGAPVAAYLPQAAAILHTELVIPPHSDVANAVGAVSGSIIQRVQVVLNPLDGDGVVRVHGLPGGPADFRGLEAAVRHAEQVMQGHVAGLATEAGAEHVELSQTREDLWAPVKGRGGEEVFLGSTLTFTAAGRPSPARRAGN